MSIHDKESYISRAVRALISAGIHESEVCNTFRDTPMSKRNLEMSCKILLALYKDTVFLTEDHRKMVAVSWFRLFRGNGVGDQPTREAPITVKNTGFQLCEREDDYAYKPDPGGKFVIHLSNPLVHLVINEEFVRSFVFIRQSHDLEEYIKTRFPWLEVRQVSGVRELGLKVRCVPSKKTCSEGTYQKPCSCTELPEPEPES